MGDAYWQATVDILQNPADPIVAKPTLTEKLLTKPPFRFLHDVISAVQAKTGFAPGLYSGQELDAKAITEKDAKVTYLQKMISVVGIVLGEEVPAKPLKIVAGLDPENTNIFLQQLGRACQITDGADAVQDVLSGGVPAPKKSAPPPPPPPEPEPELEPEPPAPPPMVEDPSPARSSAVPSPARSSQAAPSSEEPSPARSSKGSKPSSKSSSSKPSSLSKSSARKAPADDDAPPPPPEPTPAPPPPPADDPLPRPSTSMPPKFSRPVSARKAPPKLPTPTNPGIGARPPTASRRPNKDERPGTAAAPQIAVFQDNAAEDDDDVEVVQEAAPAPSSSMVAMGADQGVLVKDILEAGQKLKKSAADVQDENEPAGTGIILNSRIGAKAAAAAAAATVNGTSGAGSYAGKSSDPAALRELVQKMVQSSNPLAKSMDYLPEDIENMRKEYKFWVTERRMYEEQLASSQRQVDDRAGEAQLQDLDGQIKQAKDRIIGLKGQILRNEETIAKLLAMAVSGTK